MALNSAKHFSQAAHSTQQDSAHTETLAKQMKIQHRISCHHVPTKKPLLVVQKSQKHTNLETEIQFQTSNTSIYERKQVT